MRKTAALFLAAVLIGITAGAQTKKETALFNKTVQKISVKSADKFLKKYPESVYAPEIARLKDSIIVSHNTSLIPREEALSKAGPCLDAVGWMKDCKEHILALDEGLGIRILKPDGSPLAEHAIPVYTLADDLSSIRLVTPLEILNPNPGRFYAHFAYLNESPGIREKEYVEVLYSPESDIVYNAMFYGKSLPAKPGESFRIEGQSPENIEGLTLSPEVAWLLESMGANPSLVPVSKADILTDASIAWWREKNPGAETSAGKLTFGTLDPESSLVERYKKTSKERGKSWNAALFDCRGWTVIVAANKTSGNYALVWAEPVCRNRARDKYLNAVFFESDGITLDLVYYKAKKTLKIKVSMANGSVRRIN